MPIDMIMLDSYKNPPRRALGPQSTRSEQMGSVRLTPAPATALLTGKAALRGRQVTAATFVNHSKTTQLESQHFDRIWEEDQNCVTQILHF